MQLGIVLFTSDRGITPATAAQTAEQLGFDSFYVPEHTHMPVQREALHPSTGTTELPDDRYMRTLDPWVALAAASAVTDRIRLGTAVALPVEHDPIALAKTIASVDHLSGGRVMLGVGFGWNIDELTDHGVPRGRRRTMLREYLEAMSALWCDEVAAYDGEFVAFGPSWAWPKPLQQIDGDKRKIPVLVGAAGTEKNFAWITRSAHGWITTPTETDITESIARLQKMWQDAGRAGQPHITALAGKPDSTQLERWRDAGVSEVLFGLPDRSSDEVIAYLHRLADKLKLTTAQGA
ncbi:LLM class F420-dependent oxidoreductase [Hoyosella sp. YIM 151337]|uniref:LLM class F420-dependent oxidoreductase n=1 Tax=Hoyosella sp. YIM 151337 TaxID=2992742 RepID=UPI002236A836|nr:LLM class F420-dependent oxidoreductase [Hoyosella sp. YIM 151337]MCW4353371.1 LLM class F420-dependent oxidoreductase [Hoyosella sp. YIM 151337]